MRGQNFKWTQITPSIVSCKLDSNIVCCRFTTASQRENVYIIIILSTEFPPSLQRERWQIIKIIIKHCLPRYAKRVFPRMRNFFFHLSFSLSCRKSYETTFVSLSSLSRLKSFSCEKIFFAPKILHGDCE